MSSQVYTLSTPGIMFTHAASLDSTRVLEIEYAIFFDGLVCGRVKGGRKSAEGWARRAEKAIAAVFRSLAHRVLGRLGAGCGAARWLGRSRTTHGPPRRPLEPSRRGPEAVAKTARR